ncbi:hypothetical protein OPQ81_001010 [Rhizoctonia solani]|nr:hypothetical protein OPQ81_001010 [Rhizoctonia solani]
MPYHSRPLSESEIDALPLRFVQLERGEEDVFTDVLLKVWFALAQSGSLATLPPVPDIVNFLDHCAIFYLIFHTNPSELKLAPGDRLTSAPPSPLPNVASSSKAPTRSSPNRRSHPSTASSSSTPWNPASLSDEVIGCVYLSHSPSIQSSLDIGIALRPEARARGFGRATITKFLRFSFEHLRVHRVVANVFGPSDLNQEQSARESGTVRWIFEKIGFVPEGVQRRAAFSPAEGIWRDVYPLAMLDVDWVRLCGRSTQGRAGISSPFDAMLERHNTEREEMSDWMEDPSWGQLRRVSSTETIKGHDEPVTEAQEPPAPNEAERRSPSPIRSESSFSIPSEHDWRSVTPSTDQDYSVVSHSPPPDSPDSSAISLFSLSSVASPYQEITSTPNLEPTPFSIIGSPDLEPPLSPGFSTTSDDVIELASLPLPALAPRFPPLFGSPELEPAPCIVGPMPTLASRNPFAGDEPIEYWPSDSDFDDSERDQ